MDVSRMAGRDEMPAVCKETYSRNAESPKVPWRCKSLGIILALNACNAAAAKKRGGRTALGRNDEDGRREVFADCPRTVIRNTTSRDQLTASVRRAS